MTDLSAARDYSGVGSPPLRIDHTPKTDEAAEPSHANLVIVQNEDGFAEVSDQAKRKRRAFATADKLRILQESEQLIQRGDLAALLRRESIYSSHLAAWRKAYALRGPAGLEAAKPGRKPKLDSRDERIHALESRVALLERELERARRDVSREAEPHRGTDLSGREA